MLFNLQDPALFADPYPAYAELHAKSPVFRQRVGTGEFVFFARHADVTAALKHPHVGHRDADCLTDAALKLPAAQRPLWDMQQHWMLYLNPPTHSRLRGLVNKAFSPRIVEALRPVAVAHAHRLLDEAVSRGPVFDLIADYACPLPLAAVAQLIGVPGEDMPLLRDWTAMLVGTMDLLPDVPTLEAGARAAAAFQCYLLGLIDARRKQPEADLITALVAAEEAGQTLSEAEMTSTCILLLAAGHETTQNLIGNGVYALLRDPAQWQSLSNAGSTMRPAVEELLRYDSPIQVSTRVALQDVHIGGMHLPRGSSIGLLSGAANHDPAVFAQPGRLDLQRSPNPHLAFGGGIHFCLGAMLARMEAEVALEVLRARMPGLSLAQPGPLPYRNVLALRGLETLPVVAACEDLESRPQAIRG